MIQDNLIVMKEIFCADFYGIFFVESFISSDIENAYVILKYTVGTQNFFESVKVNLK